MVTENGQSDGNTSFLRAARAGHLDKVLEHLKQNIDINTSNANGLNALHLASKDGHVEVVKELLSRGAAVDAATKKGNTALHIASLAGQEEVVKLLIQHGASVNVQSQNGFTPLYMAAQENHDNVVKFLLANGANQSLATEDGFTPLAVAMQQGHEKVVTVLLENDTRGKVRLPALHIAAKKDDVKAAKLLLENDHNPDVTSKSGFTPLHIASHYGNEAIANLLIQKGADVNYAAKHYISPLHVAAKWGKTNMVALLLEKGANIEAKTRDGLTPLHCAARSGHEQVVDMLLEKGAPISSKTKNGLAPLHMAAQGDHVDAARILLYHRAPVDEVTVDYLTALHVAAHCGHVRVAKLLLDRGADANARALNGFTPLHIACKKNRIKVVELLLKHGASIEATTESGLTPLHVASFMGCMNIVIYLLQHNANPDVPTVRGETPLHLAARANQTDIIRILLRNGANVDARAREQQTPLHIASRLGNVDIVMLLLQHGAKVDTTTKDMYTALHIASKEGQDEVAAVLIDNGASVNAATKKGFTSLHLAAKYGHIKVAKLLLQKEAQVDAQGKNGVTPLHVASHYDHQNVALLLLDKGASPHAAAKNGHTPLHIAAKKNQMDIANTLLEYGAEPNIESKAGFTPLHLSSQEGHDDMSSLLLEHKANPNCQAKNGLTPMHLCAQEDRVRVAEVLVKNGADVDVQTKSGYTPLHIACHYGQINMVRFLLNNSASVKSTTNLGYTPLHQAAQQGHTLIVNILLKNKAQPNAVTVNGQTPLDIAQKLGYISVIETLKVVTETTIITTTVTTTEEKYRVVAPEAMQETFMSDSEEEGGGDILDDGYGQAPHEQHVYLPYFNGTSLTREDTVLAEHAYRYLTADEMKSLGDDSLPIDVTRDEKVDSNKMVTSADSNTLPPQAIDESVSPQHVNQDFIDYARRYTPDNMEILKHPVNIGKLHWKNFLVSFLVDARGGAMRGCRHSGVRVIVPPRCAASPTRITCRYVRPQRTPHPPPLMEGEALASRILELGPVGAKFLGPVIIEVPHFAALRGKEREIVILRSDNGETWREHTIDAAEEIMNDVLSKSFEEEDLSQLEDLSSGRITRIVTNDFPQYFAVVTRIHQEVHAIGPEGGMVSSTVVPQVQAVFPQGALTKKIKVGLQAQPIDPELTAKLLGHGVAVSPVVTVEPRRRKFHKAITLSMPAPRAHSQGMINQYSGSAPTLRLLCSITGGTTRAQWEDVTGSTPLTFVNDCVSFTTTVSARFWLMDCRNIGDATKMATELYREAIHVPFMAKFVVFAKRIDPLEARLRVFCMTDDKEDKTLEQQEHFTEVAKSRDVEVLEGKPQYIEFAGNLVPITKSGEQLQFSFRAFRENRLPFSVRVKDQHAEAIGRCLFMREPKVAKGDPPQQPICILNIVLPDDIVADTISLTDTDSFKKSGFLHDEFEYYMPDPRISDMSNLLGEDWVPLAAKLGLTTSEINVIKSEYPDSVAKQAQSMLRMWRAQAGNKAHSNILESALRSIGRDDIIEHCLSIQQTDIQRKEERIKEELYDKETARKIESEIIRAPIQKDDDLKKDESYESKYSAEEKAIDESDDEETFKKSVSERRNVIERKMSADRTVPSTQRIEIVQEISSIKRQSLVEDKVAEAEEKQKTIIKPYTPSKTKTEDTSVKEDILRQKSEEEKLKKEKTTAEYLKDQSDTKLLEGVSQKLIAEERISSICTNEDPYSPKLSKTPPPSPADFILREKAAVVQGWDKKEPQLGQQASAELRKEEQDAVFGQLTQTENVLTSQVAETSEFLQKGWLPQLKTTMEIKEEISQEDEESELSHGTYSEKKKFWESISQEKGTDKKLDSTIPDKVTEVADSSVKIISPPIPKPRQAKLRLEGDVVKTDKGTESKQTEPGDTKKPVKQSSLKTGDSFGSETGLNQTSYDNTGYISDSEDVEHYISDSEIEDRVPQIRERQMSVFYPTTGFGRKSIYERSLSLPTEDLYDIKNQLQLKKQKVEELIKKGMVVEQLSTEFEEELPPEYKAFELDHSKEEQKPSDTRSTIESTDDEVEQISEEKGSISKEIHEPVLSKEEDRHISEKYSSENLQARIDYELDDSSYTKQDFTFRETKAEKEDQKFSTESIVHTFERITEHTDEPKATLRKDDDLKEMKEDLKYDDILRDGKTEEDKHHVTAQQKITLEGSEKFMINEYKLKEINKGFLQTEIKSYDHVTIKKEQIKEKGSVVDSTSDTVEETVTKSYFDEKRKEESENLIIERDKLFTKEEITKLETRKQTDPKTITKVTEKVSEKTESFDAHFGKDIAEKFGDFKASIHEETSKVHKTDTHADTGIFKESVLSSRPYEADLHLDKSEIEELEKDTEGKRTGKLQSKEQEEILKSPINLPEQQIESTVWETPVQVSSSVDERATEFIMEKEKLDTLAQSSFEEDIKETISKSPDKMEVEEILIQSLSSENIAAEEAKKIAASLMEDIEKEIQKCKTLTTKSDTALPEQPSSEDNAELKSCLLKLAEEKGLDKREMQLVESVLARKQRELVKASEEVAHASSVEITDEDLKYSGVEVDYSPSTSRSYILEQLEAEKQQQLVSEMITPSKEQIMESDEGRIEFQEKEFDDKGREIFSKTPTIRQVEDLTSQITSGDIPTATLIEESEQAKEDSYQSPDESKFDIEQTKTQDDSKAAILRKDKDSSSSSNVKSDRRSGTDFESYSSSGESHYQSFEVDSSKSRPCSSDFEGVNVVASSEYESALTSQHTSGISHGLSDYHTAISTLTSKESMKSLDSESSGNLASFETSEASETLVPSAFENESDILEPVEVTDDFNIRMEQPIEEKAFTDTPSKMKRSHEMTFQPELKILEPEFRISEKTDDEQQSDKDVKLTKTEIKDLEVTVASDKDKDFSEIKSTTESYTSTASTVIEVPLDSITLTSATFSEGNTSYASTQVVSKFTDDIEKTEQTMFHAEATEPKKRGHRRSESTLSGQIGQIPQMSYADIKEKCSDFISRESQDVHKEYISEGIPSKPHEAQVDKRITKQDFPKKVDTKSIPDGAHSEVAFTPASYVSPTHKVKPICPIIEDENEEVKEIALAQQKVITDSYDDQATAGAIPDIRVTQHMAPLKDKGFHYPDLELEEQQTETHTSTPETPASGSSKTSEETDQGREYVITDSIGVIPETESTQADEKEEKLMTESKSETATVLEKTLQDIPKEGESPTESPDSDSFEMLEKPDLIDDFVVIEEVAKEASEQDQEGKSVKIEHSKRIVKKHDEEVENYLIQSSSKQTQLITKKDLEQKDDLAFDFDSSPPMPDLKSASEPDSKTKEYFNSYEQELEINRKWIEQQFQGDQATMAAGYGYEMEFERAPLEDIKEEEITDFDSSRIGSLGSHKEGSIGSVKDSYSSTPEYDVLAGRKYFTRSGEHDDASVSSLQEFENLERAMSLENKRIHQGSQDSSSTSGSSFGKRYYVDKNGQGDEISTNSLKEFEGLEKACIAVHKIEEKVKQEEALLTQIEEGLESAASESESCETVSGLGKKTQSSEVDSDKKIFEIDEIIRQAQCNLDQFIDFKDDEKPESIGRGDSLEEVSKIPDLDLDTPLSKNIKVQWAETEDPMINSTDSLDLQLEKSTHYDSTDSLDQKTMAKDVMTASTDSIEFQSKQKSDRELIRTDSFDNKEEKDKSCVMTLSDSLELAAAELNYGALSDSIDDEGSRIAFHEHSSSSSGKDLSSSVKEEATDKAKVSGLDLLPEQIEDAEVSTSTATHATYQNETDSVFSGSFTSGSNTMVSSTETIDPGTETVNLPSSLDKLWFENMQRRDLDLGECQEPYISEIIEPLEGDDKYSHVIHRKVELPPTISKVTFTGTDAEEQLRKYLESVDPSEKVEETEEIDEFGNVHTRRIVKKQVVMGTDIKSWKPLEDDENYSQIIHRKIELPPTIKKVTFTGADAEEQLKKYLESAGPSEEIEETEDIDEYGNICKKRIIKRHSVVERDTKDAPFIEKITKHSIMKDDHMKDIYSLDISELPKTEEMTSGVQKLLTSIAESTSGESSSSKDTASSTIKGPDSTTKGDDTQGKGIQETKERQIQDQHKLSEEMEQLLEAMKDTSKK